MKTFQFVILSTFFCFLAQPIFAQENTKLQPLLPVLPNDTTCHQPVPTISLEVPNAYGCGYAGVLNFGGTLQSRTRLSGDRIDPDGNLSFGIGLGNPERWLGAEIRTNIYGLLDNRGAGDNFGEGTLDLHLSRKLDNSLWIGAGVYDFTGWKREEPNQLYSGYLTATKIFTVRDSGLFSKIFLTIGAGNGRFRRDDDFNVKEESGVGVFGSLAVAISPKINFMAEWKGYDVASNISFFPFKKLPAQIVVGLNDVFHENRSFILAGSFAIYIFQPKGNACRRKLGWQGPPPAQPSRN